MDRANGAFLETLRESVLTPRVVRRVVGRALELATAVSEDPESRRQPIQEELRQLDVEIARYTDAVGRDEPLPSLLEALRARERRRRELQAQIQELEGMARLVEGSGLGAKLTDWQGLLERQPIQARQLLRKLLVGRLIYTPHRDEAGGYYEFTGTASFGRLLSGTTAGQLRWCPRPDLTDSTSPRLLAPSPCQRSAVALRRPDEQTHEAGGFPGPRPLPWLVAFANLGIDRRQARGRIDVLLSARTLALGDDPSERQGYALDPAAPYDVELATAPGRDSITQRRGRNTLHWYRKGAELHPAPGLPTTPPVRVTAEIPGAVFEDLTPRPRAIMAVDHLTWERPVPDDIQDRFAKIQNVVRVLLGCVWYVRTGHSPTAWGRLLVTAVHAIGQSSFGRPGVAEFPEAEWADCPAESEWRDTHEGLFRLICDNAGQLWITPSPGRISEYAAATMPGIAWAEVLNLLEHHWPAASRLGWCGWCGGFFVGQPSPGRPRMFCPGTPCRRRFHDRGPHETRRPHARPD